MPPISRTFPTRNLDPTQGPPSPPFKVVLAWVSTGQVCDDRGKWLTAPASFKQFDALETARQYSETMVRKLPFIEANIFAQGERLVDVVINSAFESSPFRSNRSPGKFSVRLFQWVSNASLLLDGSYKSEDEPEPLLEFESYPAAREFGRKLSKQLPDLNFFIYDRDGAVTYCNATRVDLSASGKIIYARPWWDQIQDLGILARLSSFWRT